jgi:hypothetical protein
MDASDGQRVRRRCRSDVSDVAATRLLGIAINGSFLRWRKSVRIAKSAWHMAELYARPSAMHAGFAQFAAFDQDAKTARYLRLAAVARR